MEYRTLTNTTTRCMYEAFSQAFSDYQVSVDMPLESFEIMLKRNGFMPEVSAGAFDNGVLVGLVLNGVREWDGEKTIYDLGTGVIPAYRRKGITEKLLDLVKELCRENNIGVYQLEVIQTNEGAVALYQKQGFQVKRALNCYSLEGKLAEPEENAELKLHRPQEIEAEQWDILKSFWNYPPSWQNGIDAVCAIPDTFGYTLAESDGTLIGYGIVQKANGDIVQLAVDLQHRRKGVATEILLDLQKQSKKSGMTAINVDGRDEAANGFLKQMGFGVFVTQYEMAKSLR